MALTLVLAALIASTAPVARSRPTSAVAGAAPAVSLKVMTFNIEYGGQVIDFDKVVEAVVKADADVVGLNEAYSRAKLVAAQAGYPYISARLDLISKYPILDPPGANGRYQFVQVSPGQVIAITNVHLPSEPYGPRRVMDGWSRRRVLRNERQTRLPEIKPLVQALEPVAAAGIPSFIIGDFNAPTHYDWTPRMVGQRPQIRYAVRWPVSVYLAEHGFADTFHEAHPNVRATPGLTWPSGRPRSDTSWNPPPDAPQDRIDQIWVAGPAATTDSEVVGERGGPGVTIDVNPWGSDHRAVVSTVEAVLGMPPIMVSPDPLLVEQGQDLTVTYHAPGNAGEKVVIVPMGGDAATDGIDQAGTPAADDVDGNVVFDTATWTAGGYDAVLVDASDTELSRNLFWLRLPGERPVLNSASWSYDVGEPIRISWEGAPAHRFDWIGIYARDADPQAASYKDYLYTRGTLVGTATFRGRTVKHWPLRPGRYTAYLLVSDIYLDVAGVDFVIKR